MNLGMFISFVFIQSTAKSIFYCLSLGSKYKFMFKYLISAILLSFFTFSFAQEVKYKLEMPKPQNHYFNVEMNLIDFTEKEVNVKMPIWAPGSYLAREFAQNVNLVKAFGDNGEELPIKKINKNTWRIQKGKAKNVKVKYEVYSFQLTVRTSFLDLTHGFVSGSGIFMYAENHKDKKGTVEVVPYHTFKKITTALKKSSESVSSDGSTVFEYEDYDQLVDCPIEIGNQKEFTFEAAGVKHKVAMYNEGNYSVDKLKVDMAKVVEAATTVFGVNPNKEYTFIIHNVVNAQGGLEHRNSTVLSVNRWTYQGANYKGFLKLVAHEYFHLWNVKRFRPIELGPFNYDAENYTSLLWVMEGFTTYYEKMILLRAGFYSQTEFLDKMFSGINYVEGSVGARVQPVSHASFDAWIKAYRHNENSANTTMTYYTRGSNIAMMLDAIIIDKSNGKQKLDDFVRKVYNKYYIKLGRGFSESEFKQELIDFIGDEMNDFYAKYIDGTEIPDYNAIFSPIGLKVEYIGEAKPSVGMSTSESNGKIIVRRIRANSPAEEAGISVNDEIIGCNGYRVDKKALDSFFKNAKENEVIEVLFAREKQLYSAEIVVRNYEAPKFKYILSSEKKAKNKFNFWLSK